MHSRRLHQMAARLCFLLFLPLFSCTARHAPTGAFEARRRSTSSFGQDVRSALAGGLAGGVTNGILHPIDCAKTLRQARPGQFTGTWNAMVSIARTRGPRGLYGGVVPAVVGAIPSSALYFGAYESIKRRLRHLAERDPGARGTAGVRLRPAVHMVSAASGNMLSSLIFVPKEIVKQKRQTAVALGEDASSAIKVVVGMLQSNGLGALYAGYFATLLRNIPSAVLRFTMYLIAGAASGLFASAATTPMDVVKTKIATGVLDRNLGILGCLRAVAKSDGVLGLYSGLHGRIVWSMLFSAIGFTSFEFFKDQLGVQPV